jgi:hypothetical protein
LGGDRELTDERCYDYVCRFSEDEMVWQDVAVGSHTPRATAILAVGARPGSGYTPARPRRVPLPPGFPCALVPSGLQPVLRLASSYQKASVDENALRVGAVVRSRGGEVGIECYHRGYRVPIDE